MMGLNMTIAYLWVSCVIFGISFVGGLVFMKEDRRGWPWYKYGDFAMALVMAIWALVLLVCI